MDRGGKNGQRGGRGGSNRGWGQPRGGGGGGQRNNNGPSNSNQRPNSGGTQQGWPSLGRPNQQGPSSTTTPPSGSWRAGPSGSGGNGSANSRPIDRNVSQPQTAQPPPAWPRLPQGPAQPQSNPWQSAAPRPLGVPSQAPINATLTPPIPSNPISDNISVESRPQEQRSSVVREEARGATRGKRTITTDFIKTKPSGVVTKCGTSGRQVTVQANYFHILKKLDWSIHQYRIDFSPDVEMVKERKFYVRQNQDKFGGCRCFIFDGTVLFTTTYLPEARAAPIELLTKNQNGETIQIKVKHVGIVEASDIQQLHVLNLIMRNSMDGLKLQQLNHNYYDPKAVIQIPQHKLEIWPGYITSIRQHERDILLCCEISHKVLRTDTLYDILMKCTHESNPQDVFKRKVVGSIVLTDYNNKTYRIDDVDFTQNAKSTFTKNGVQMSYLDYYKQTYNITIRDPGQPLLISRPKEKDIRGGQTRVLSLIPELSRATGMTDEMRKDFMLMKAMSEHTRVSPDKRIQRLITYNRRLKGTPESIGYLQAWQMNLDSNLVEAPARVLPPGKILFGNGASYTCQSDASWDKEFRSKHMRANIAMNRWCVIAPGRSIKQFQTFIEMCIRAGKGMGMSIAMPRFKEMPDDRTASYARAIDDMSNLDCQLLMIVLNRQNEEKYSCVKKKCCVDKPVPSQVCTLSTIERSKNLMSIATKVVIQMNAKLGGTPWSVDIQLKDAIMFIGFDVCHSAKDRNKSYGALVASMDTKRSGTYFSTVMQHLKGQELSNEIVASVTMALHAYKDELGGLPDRIVFYRDGVGEGQLHQVYNIEIKALSKKLDEIYAKLKLRCKMAFIVVSKRINTRYFTNGRNPEPGTVVDDIITMPERYDFYLVSQSVRQGTVSPTSYNIIYDTSGFNADVLQRLTYVQTHMYYNWSGTCRVPAVCQYAHKLAALVAEHIHYNPSNALSKKLYFL